MKYRPVCWPPFCSYVILGHSERRMYYGETDETLWNKLCQALANGLRPIFCVGELLEEREANQHFQVVASQLKHVIGQLQQDDFEKIIIAYEPVWAIGTGKTATSDQAQEMHAFIRSFLAGTFGRATEKTPILYGGSVTSNAKELFRPISGLMRSFLEGKRFSGRCQSV